MLKRVVTIGRHGRVLGETDCGAQNPPPTSAEDEGRENKKIKKTWLYLNPTRRGLAVFQSAVMPRYRSSAFAEIYHFGTDVIMSGNGVTDVTYIIEVGCIIKKLDVATFIRSLGKVPYRVKIGSSLFSSYLLTDEGVILQCRICLD